MARKSLHVSPRGMRWCSHCQTDKAPEEFRRLIGPEPLDRWCMDCRREYTKEWRKKNPDKFAASIGKRRGDRSPGVYIVDIGWDHIHKIGKCVRIKERMIDLTAANPKAKLVLFLPTDDPHTLEHRLHKKFADRRVERELFHLTEEDLAELAK